MTNRIPSSSVNITKENIEAIKALFPEVLTDGDKIDFDKLRTVLGEEINNNHERYNFSWYGKKDSILGAQKPSKGTLRPDIESSKKFDITENLYIEGDNLEVLKLLQKSYSDKVKMIYIDPPYNTGTDIIYKNKFHDPLEYYLSFTGQSTDGNLKITTNTETSGRFHTDWLNMMYSRIKLSRNILHEDGFFVIAIDHNELFNLGKICDELYGENNRIAIVSVVHKPEGRNQAKFIGPSHEYMFIYAKDITRAKLQRVVLDEELLKKFNMEDSDGLFRLKNFIRLSDGKYSTREAKPAFWYPIYVSPDLNRMSLEKEEDWLEVYPVTTSGIERTWKTTEGTFLDRYNEGNIIAMKEEGNTIIYEKLRENEVIKTHWINKKYHGFHFGTKVIDELLKIKTFDFPKSLYLMKDIIKLIMPKNGILLDFFSGSSTTAHATMELNAEDDGNRKFIMVQLPEKIDLNSEAYKEGYKNICDIGKERIRRAGEKILEEHPESAKYLDIGFKVLKLDKSNIREWNADFDELETTLETYADIFVPDRSELDIVYEIMLKNGLELTYPMTSFQVDEKNIYDIASGNLFICLDDEINQSIAQAIIEKRDAHETETSTVVFKDSGFNGNDSEKLNCFELLKDAGYNEEHLMTI